MFLKRLVARLFKWLIVNIFEVGIHILPGGTMPERQTNGAEGFDVFLRAIVSPYEMDPDNKKLRKAIFDFQNMPTDESVAKKIERKENGELVYRLDPGESVLVGIGFVTEMPFPMFYWTAPRSGLAGKYKVTLINAPGTVDSDYRGEAGVLVENRNKEETYYLEHNMRISQIVFQFALIPQFRIVENYDDLSKTDRGAGGFGSTGVK